MPELTADRFVGLDVIRKRLTVNCKPLTDHGPRTTDHGLRTTDDGLPISAHRLPNTVYRTGDLVRYRADGTLVFIARMDNQVKVRGFRIELGEIETVLGQHEQVRQGVVAVHEATGGDKRLVAYVLPEGDTPTISDIRRFLGERLPSYMVVTDMIVLDSFPLTPNGKIDRKALPAPSSERPQLDTTYIAPRSPLEQSIAAIWRDVLGVEQIGTHDNFFDLGGHSLLMVQVHTRLQAEMKRPFLMIELFRYPTIHALAQYFHQLDSAHQAAEQIETQAEKRKTGKQRLADRRKRRHRATSE